MTYVPYFIIYSMKYENSVGTYRRLSADCVLYHVAVNFKLKTNDYKLNR